MRSIAIALALVTLWSGWAAADVFRSEPALAIPDNVPAGVSDVINATPPAIISDVDIELEIDHTWIGDIIATVTHGVTTVLLIDRPGNPSGTFGCGQDLACARPIVLDDEVTSPIECGDQTQCATCFPGGQVPGGSYAPNESLTAFDNADQDGSWTLTISDNAAADTGTLCAWEVRTTRLVPVEPATWGSIKARFDD